MESAVDGTELLVLAYGDFAFPTYIKTITVFTARMMPSSFTTRSLSPRMSLFGNGFEALLRV